ncbi:MAG: 50S ribosomal protein L10, partial [Clostridiales bacterium]|nr:50S ribosomal protein L10 [Clostridiales bacterium]
MSVEAKKAKQVVIDEIKEKFEKAGSIVAVDYLGLTVAEADKMRADLRKEGVDFTVYKNTLIKRAIDGTEFAGLADGEVLKGSTALAFSGEDVTAGARASDMNLRAQRSTVGTMKMPPKNQTTKKNPNFTILVTSCMPSK